MRAAFERYIGIDYSGAKTPTSSLKGLRVYMADGASPPAEVEPRLAGRWLPASLRDRPLHETLAVVTSGVRRAFREIFG